MLLRPMGSRLLRFVLPSIVGVLVALGTAALLEAAIHTRTLFETASAAGFVLVLVALPAITASILLRALYRLWRFDDLVEGLAGARGEVPRLAAWVIFLLFAALALGAAIFQGGRILFASTRVHSLIVLGMPVVGVAAALVIAALSRPCVDGLSGLFEKLERRRQRRGRAPIVTVRATVLVVLVIVAGATVASWFLSIRPSIGHLDVSFLWYVGLFAVLGAALPAMWHRFRAVLRHTLTCVALSSTLALVVCALVARYQRPFAMLETWGSARIAGFAIDTLFDVQSVRVDLDLEGIEPEANPGASHPSIVLVTIDTVRADNLSLYGGKAQVDTLRSLAKEGTVAERAFSPGNVTRRSLPTIATGISPHRVRGRVVGWALRMDPRHVLVAERLRAGGYDTAGFFCCRSHFGRDHRLGLIRGLDHVEIEYDGAKLASQAAEWLEARSSNKPLFMWAHFIEPHNWHKDYSNNSEHNKRARYRLSLEATDRHLGALVDSIRRHLGEDTIIVVTADHGEGLGDHGIPFHSGTLYNSEIRVPLVVAGPQIKRQRLQQVVGLVDLAPTIMELAGFRPPGLPQMDGLSIAPELTGDREDKLGMGEAYSLMVADRSVQSSQAAVVSGHYKLIEKEGGKLELYNLTRDPLEKRNLVDSQPELLEAMEARLARRRRIDRVPPF